jgi:hypothetical protein
MMNMETKQLSDIAQAIIDGYWTLCSGKEAIQYAIDDYLSRTDDSWSHDGETPVSPQEFLLAISEVMDFFDLTSEKDIPTSPSRVEGLISALRRHPVSRGRTR